MICAVYRSSKRPNTYLFLAKKDDFSLIPSELLQLFGRPELFMLLSEAKLNGLKAISKEKLLQELARNHYWLWIKQEEENLLKQHHSFLLQENSHE
ncbi:MAG: YcgL domain-containing protein [Tolumonas sp.]|uniref:YcgL domain-containing protein n=1 Tax=uncultured Tolumonas sp. TaxID=263765 RepID=UPI002A0A46D9|nr:YcgL domain-containing protein [uncultured Tolumonas sp.]MDD2342252.1 YcgL domain-containing protein [Tolumonas sp.]